MALQVKGMSVPQTSSINASTLVLPSARSSSLAFKPATRSTKSHSSGRVASASSTVQLPLPLPVPLISILPIRLPLPITLPLAPAPATPAATHSPAADLAMDSLPAVPKTMNAFLAEAAAGQSDLLLLFNALQTATKMIAGKVARAGIENLYGSSGEQNSSGDKQKKLDVVSVGGFSLLVASALQRYNAWCAVHEPGAGHAAHAWPACRHAGSPCWHQVDGIRVLLAFWFYHLSSAQANAAKTQ
jgi:hypothetical protein